MTTAPPHPHPCSAEMIQIFWGLYVRAQASVSPPGRHSVSLHRQKSILLTQDVGGRDGGRFRVQGGGDDDDDPCPSGRATDWGGEEVAGQKGRAAGGLMGQEEVVEESWGGLWQLFFFFWGGLGGLQALVSVMEPLSHSSGGLWCPPHPCTPRARLQASVTSPRSRTFLKSSSGTG